MPSPCTCGRLPIPVKQTHTAKMTPQAKSVSIVVTEKSPHQERNSKAKRRFPIRQFCGPPCSAYLTDARAGAEGGDGHVQPEENHQRRLQEVIQLVDFGLAICSGMN